jgi:type II secretory pathway component PulK
MANRTFQIRASKNHQKAASNSADGVDVAARYFVYKLYEATDRRPMQWATLHEMGESAATTSRAVERGWIILEGTSVKPLERKAALTDEGRRLARKGR